MEHTESYQDAFSNSDVDIHAHRGDIYGIGHPDQSEGITHTGLDLSGPFQAHTQHSQLHDLGDTTYLSGLHNFTFNTTLGNLFEQPYSAQITTLEQLIPLVRDYVMQQGGGDEVVNGLYNVLSQVQSGSLENAIDREEFQEAFQEAYDLLGPALFIEATSSIGFA